MSSQWEYKILTYKLGWKGFNYDQMEQDLNEYGRQGWESLSPMAPSYGQGQAIELIVILKRPHT